MKEDNKRQRDRVDFEIGATFTHQNKTYTCKCNNVSMGGVLLETSTFFSVGDVGSVYIILNSGSEILEITGSCRVVRVVPYGNDSFQLGLEFESLDSESSIVLYNMVRYQKV